MADRHSFGYIPDVKDPSDFAFQAMRPPTVPLPNSVDLRHMCSPVRDQGQLGACTGFAIAVGLREFIMNKLGQPFVPMSPLFLYYEERAREKTINEDAGAQPRDGFKVLSKTGCAPEADWPYDITKFKQKPSQQAMVAAADYKIASYHRLKTVTDMESCLASGFGFVMGFKVYESFESDAVASTGKMPMPQPNEQVLGGHAVFCAGYQCDNSEPGGGHFIIKNSWNTNWGDQGYFYMPFAYATPELLPDAWMAVL